MKTYQEMVQWVVDNNDKLRYHEWPALMSISEVYNVPYETAAADVQTIKIHRERAQKDLRRAQSRASNEQRRLANLAKVQE
jgi:methylglyoxal synthase